LYGRNYVTEQNSKDQESVLVVPDRAVQEWLAPQDDWAYHEPTPGPDIAYQMLHGFEQQAEFAALRRGQCEHDIQWRQIIPYVMVGYQGPWTKYRRALLTYSRVGGVDHEDRLRGLRSLGIGGHVGADHETLEGPVDFLALIIGEALREVYEETGLRFERKDLRLLGALYSDESVVQRVHLGLVFFAETTAYCFMDNHELKRPAMVLADAMDLEEVFDSFEMWSKLCVRHYVPRIPEREYT
jgi:predicted NUDIX family phosphoesterase